MRICLFTPTFLPQLGGAERNADLLARGLTARGHDVRVLAQHGRVKHPDLHLPYPVQWYSRPPAQHLWPEALCWTLWRRHKHWPFDVCLAFYSYPTGYAASLLKHRLRFALVISPRGSDLHENFHMLGKPRVRGVITRGYRDADRIVAISAWMARRARELVGDALPPVDVVHNGTDIEEIDRLRDASRAAPPPVFGIKGPFILHLAKLHSIKGQRLLLDALPPIHDELRRRGVSYVLAGGGEDLEPLRAAVRERGFEDVVLFLGPRVGIEKAWLMDHALFNVTTSIEEALGSVLVESIACGLPMLASNIPPHRELIEGRKWGMLFESGNAADLSRMLMGMLDADLAAMRREALSLRPEYTLETMIARYERACLLAAQARQIAISS